MERLFAGRHTSVVRSLIEQQSNNNRTTIEQQWGIERRNDYRNSVIAEMMKTLNYVTWVTQKTTRTSRTSRT